MFYQETKSYPWIPRQWKYAPIYVNQTLTILHNFSELFVLINH